ncbi:MAG: transcription elongation factor subunit Spt4 [Nanoarchaeota archaeon]
MAKKKACKECKAITEADECPYCKSTNLTTVFQGRVSILDPSKSEVAKRMSIHDKGEYAIKTRG